MIKDSDKKIMAALRKNSRDTLTNISKKTGIPVSTVYDRIRTHENSAIKKHTSKLDFPELGYSIRAHILVNTENKEKFTNKIQGSECINSMFRIEGDYDFSLDCIFNKMSDMQEFMSDLDNTGISKKQVHFVTDELVRENFMNLEGN